MSLGYLHKFSPMTAHAVLKAERVAGGGKYEIHGEGDMSVAFMATNDRDVMEIQLREINLKFDAFFINMPGLKRKVRIPGFRVDTTDIELQNAKGTFHTKTKNISLTLPILLNPNKIPILSKFGIFKSARVIAVESGKMDPDTGYLETHAEPFRLPPPFNFLTVHPGQFAPPCSVGASLGVVTRAFCDRGGGVGASQKEVIVCPGEGACLIWSVSGPVSRVTVEPGVGMLEGGSGVVEVVPAVDTTYRIKAVGQDCTREDTATVHVVSRGSKWTLIASWQIDGRCVWSVFVPPEFASETVKATSIKHIACPIGGGIWARWSGRHISPDGSITLFEARVDAFTDIGGIPLAGTWDFTPIGLPTCDPRDMGLNVWPNDCFEVTLQCGS